MIIDLQQAIDDPSWGKRNNLEAEDNIAKLLEFWRSHKQPILHVKHMSTESNSLYRPGQIGNNFKTVAQPTADEEVLEKNINSAFISTNLEQKLKEREIHEIVIVGVITNNSVEATARMSGNLGFRTVVVSNATFTFGKHDYVGNWRTAEEVHNMSLANLSGEYGEIYSSSEVLALMS
jgi:nicotinamidase-related amidase